MQLTVPLRIEYQTNAAVPIEEIIDSLLAVQTLVQESGRALEVLAPGLKVEKVTVSVQEITHGSLKEILLIGLFAYFQDDLHRELPPLIKEFTGVEVSKDAETLLVVLTLVIIVYGVGFMKDAAVAAVNKSQMAAWKEELVSELARMTGQTTAEISAALDQRFEPKAKVKLLARAATRFFRPSKSQNNAPILVGSRKVTTDIVSEVPDSHYQETSTNEQGSERSMYHLGVELELHQKDIDHDGSGWAAVPKGVHDSRLPMKLVNGVKPEQMWGYNTIKGDIVILSRNEGDGFKPYQIHLERIWG
jgi:hypothetical protein